MPAPCIRARKRKGKGKLFPQMDATCKVYTLASFAAPPLADWQPPCMAHIISFHAMPCHAMQYFICRSPPVHFNICVFHHLFFFHFPGPIIPSKHTRKKKEKEGRGGKKNNIIISSFEDFDFATREPNPVDQRYRVPSSYSTSCH